MRPGGAGGVIPAGALGPRAGGVTECMGAVRSRTPCVRASTPARAHCRSSGSRSSVLSRYVPSRCGKRHRRDLVHGRHVVQGGDLGDLHGQRLGQLRARGRCVETGRPAIGVDRPAVHVDVADGPVRRGEHQRPQRVDAGPHRGVGEVDQHQVRPRAGGDSTDVRSSQRLCSAGGGGPKDVAHREFRGRVRADAAEGERAADLLQHVVRPGVVAHRQAHPRVPVAGEVLQARAPAREGDGTVGDRDAVIGEDRQIVPAVPGERAVVVEVDGVAEDGGGVQHAEVRQPARRGGAGAGDHGPEFRDALGAVGLEHEAAVAGLGLGLAH